VNDLGQPQSQADFFRMLSSNKNQQLLPYRNLFGERYEVSDTLLMNFIGIDGIL
jgi:hypothetical protein